jgi:hypothetical protein
MRKSRAILLAHFDSNYSIQREQLSLSGHELARNLGIGGRLQVKRAGAPHIHEVRTPLNPKTILRIAHVPLWVTATFVALHPLAKECVGAESQPAQNAPTQVWSLLAPPPSGLTVPTKLPAFDLVAISGSPSESQVGGRQLEIEADEQSHLQLTWVMQASSIDSPRVRFDLGNEWCSVQSIFPIQTDGWKIGGAYRCQYDIKISPFSYGGHGVLRVWLCDGAGEDETNIEVGRIPCWAGPIVIESALDEEALRTTIGKDARLLRKACRLFPGLEFTTPTSEGIQAPCIGIAVVSALRFSSEFIPGEDVLEVVATGKDGSHVRSVLRAGIDSSIGEFNAPRPGTIKIPQVEVFNVSPYTGATWNGQPVELTRYIGRAPFPSGIVPESIQVRYLAKTGAIDVYELALLFDHASLASPAAE